MAQVVLENIYKSFPPRKGENIASTHRPESVNVLRRINLTVADGEFMVLVGPSGCGKSTLLRIIAGLEAMTGGNIWVGDRLVNNLPPKERDIAMVFQNYALYPHMTVYDNIAFGLRRRQMGNGEWGIGNGEGGMGNREWGIGNGENNPSSLPPGVKTPGYPHSPLPPPHSPFLNWSENLLVGMTRTLPKGLRYNSLQERAVDERVRYVAQMLQIDTLLNRLPKQLSGGQRQRVALGRAIARNPQVFLMDEPLSNLDAKLRAETRAQIVKLQRQLGTTTIYVTHDQTEAMTMGDRIAILCEGNMQQIASPLELYNRPANLFVAQFIGAPPMNFIPVEFHAPLLITSGDFRLTLPEVWGTALRKYDGRTLILGIRPEHLILSMPATKNWNAQVELVENLGNDAYLSTRLIGLSSPKASTTNAVVQVRVPPDRFIRVGEQLWLSLTPEKIHFFDPDTQLAIFPES
ncbi:MAG: ABC transporter ATP-binding protein [Stigonema ocellatum SAG 48.90 = DSM 106950]|nr:ABC transporter ATP-binding protein [Stigonema ocellatum SAG 48.90 = DSM 106950]